jgi:DNA-binding XRE family transcriptional regulator
MLTSGQIKAARALLGMTQVELGKLAGIATPTIWAIERGGDCFASTLEAIQRVLESGGAEFGLDGSVRIVPASERWITEPGHSPDEATLRAAQAIIAAGKRAREPRGGLG